ncbi:MCE family protein [Solicola gregarius]|uniref:MCE family protein n=1 Tax=Solicola gregarius TaxID=2908642 RepID=A0AA46TEL4_9ACTN|nr:MlaD family protein [Solicola gregarius]UYM03725.1 MCE family protein [Solicola gregarius]
MRKGLDRQSAGSLAKLLVFILVTTLATAVLAITIGNISFESRETYKAEFSDTTSLIKGDDVRIAGVRVGTVESVDLGDDNQSSIVTMAVDDSTTLPQSTEATIKYRNLIGQRYISLEQGSKGSTEPMESGDMIPLDQTTEALDLSALFNGFKPLFQGLSPEDTNKLANELVQVLQGESGTIETLLSRTASVSQTFANRDKLIGSVITNFNDLLDTLNNRDEELDDTIVTVQKFMSGLNDDRGAITTALDSIDDLTTETASLVTDVRPALTTDIKQLRELSTRLDQPALRHELDDIIKILPIKATKLGLTGDFGPLGGVVPCEIRSDITIPAIPGISGYERPRNIFSGVVVNNPKFSGRCD